MSTAGRRSAGTRLLAAVVLSACVGLIGGGLGAWGVYTHFGPPAPVITQIKTGGGGVSVGDIATAVAPSLVTVSTQPVSADALAGGTATGLTEGFAVSADGMVLTSAQAVRGATRLRVATTAGKGYDATIAASDIAHGLVLLRATAASGMTPLRFATAAPRIGDLAIAVFDPALGTLTTRSGVVASVGVSGSDGAADLGDLINVDASPAPQAEGAPLVNSAGAVIGVVSTVASQPGLAAASGRDAAALLSAAQRGTPAPTPSFGVTSVLVTPALAGATSLEQGALIRAVDPAGPAAGLLQPGDVVTSVDGTAVETMGGLSPQAFGLLAGDKAVLQVAAPSGATRAVPITVGAG